ncbi:MAG: tRNA epoxyqueuosine(34) reductase QueG [Rikenellaceae bacterium]|nr:tRNA epoxyqueuosine(34) reductase QueG [Rikenellaceae bacterium]
MILSEHIKIAAREVGFDLCGVCRPRRMELNESAYAEWLERGYDSSLEYMRAHLDKRFDARNLVEGAQAVVVCAVNYRSPISGGYSPDDRCRVASYACCRDYHKSIKRMLLKLLDRLREQYPALSARAFTDSAPLLEKQHAVDAGLGWIGRQSLLITPRFGSRVLLGELVLCDEVDHYDSPLEGEGCGKCRRCIDGCPTGAIVKPMMLDTSRCISCRTVESEASADFDLHGWIFGCEECQNACPYNRSTPHFTNPHFEPLFDPRTISPDEWLALSDEDFSARFGSTPMKRSGWDRIRRNIRRNEKLNIR